MNGQEFSQCISDYTAERMERLEPDTGQYSEKNCSEYAFLQRIYSIMLMLLRKLVQLEHIYTTYTDGRSDERSYSILA